MRFQINFGWQVAERVGNLGKSREVSKSRASIEFVRPLHHSLREKQEARCELEFGRMIVQSKCLKSGMKMQVRRSKVRSKMKKYNE